MLEIQLNINGNDISVESVSPEGVCERCSMTWVILMSVEAVTREIVVRARSGWTVNRCIVAWYLHLVAIRSPLRRSQALPRTERCHPCKRPLLRPRVFSVAFVPLAC